MLSTPHTAVRWVRPPLLLTCVLLVVRVARALLLAVRVARFAEEPAARTVGAHVVVRGVRRRRRRRRNLLMRAVAQAAAQVVEVVHLRI